MAKRPLTLARGIWWMGLLALLSSQGLVRLLYGASLESSGWEESYQDRDRILRDALQGLDIGLSTTELVQALAHEQFLVRAYAVELLGARREEQAQIEGNLLSAVRDPVALVRVRAAGALAGFGNFAGVIALRDMLEDIRIGEFERTLVAAKLCELGYREGFDFLTAILGQEESPNRLIAVDGIAWWKQQRESVQILRRAVDATDVSLQRTAMGALYRLDSEVSAPIFIELLSHWHDTVRCSAAGRLDQMAGQAFGYDCEKPVKDNAAAIELVKEWWRMQRDQL